MKQFFLTFLTVIILLPIHSYSKTETAIFAGGCFWCVESDFDKIPGVISTESGYDGGTSNDPSYKTVSAGKTNYAESVKITFDSDKVSYAYLVNYFWHHIDPTVSNAQFCDHGKQYRSAIFYENESQKIIALKSLDIVKKELKTIYTQITTSTKFYPAEEYHQDYYKKNPLRYKYYRWNCGRDKRVDDIWGDIN